MSQIPSIQSNVWFILPHEIIIRIFGYLDRTALCNASKVSCLFRNLSRDDILWQPLFKKRFPERQENRNYFAHYCAIERENFIVRNIREKTFCYFEESYSNLQHLRFFFYKTKHFTYKTFQVVKKEVSFVKKEIPLNFDVPLEDCSLHDDLLFLKTGRGFQVWKLRSSAHVEWIQDLNIEECDGYFVKSIYLCAWDDKNRIKIWKKGKETFSLYFTFDGAINDFAFNADGFFALHSDRLVRWKDNGISFAIFEILKNPECTQISLSSQGNFIFATNKEQKKLMIYRKIDDKFVLLHEITSAEFLMCSPNENYLFLQQFRNNRPSKILISQWNSSTSKFESRQTLESKNNSFEFISAGRFVVAKSADSDQLNLKIWECDSSNLKKPFQLLYTLPLESSSFDDFLQFDGEQIILGST